MNPDKTLTDFDSPWKDALDLYFGPFLLLLFPEIYHDIDWSRGYEFLDKELLQIVPEAERGKGVVDKLVKVWRKNGEENWLLLHIEVQSQEEADFPWRMFGYSNRISDRYNRDVVSLAVLGDERPKWRPNLYRFELWGCRKEFEFPVAKLVDFLPRTAELENSDNPMAAVVLAHLGAMQTRKDPEERRNRKYQLIRNLYQRGMTATEVRQLFRLIDWFMRLPPEIERQFRDDIQKIEEEKHMPYVTSIERMAREEGLVEGLEKGRVEGLEKGRVEGLEKGRVEGLEKGARDALLVGIELALSLKFADDGPLLMPDVQKVQDVKRLREFLDAIGKVAALRELRDLLSADRAES